MKIQQFEDKGLAHFGYAILNEKTHEVVLVDPARNPQACYDFAAANNAKIVGVIETHPHADFVSSHLEIHHKTGATIYTHSLVGADYPHQAFDDGAILQVGKITLRSLHTPGHSPDSISIVLEHEGKDKAVFTGDTLFIGDVGRPDLRENAGNVTAKREELARQMYRSTREKLMKLADDVIVYPAHGSGSLCGKALSDANSSTIGAEKIGNYALQPMSEDEFVKILTEDQPFIPKYFGYDVSLNKQGAPDYNPSINSVKRLEKNFTPEEGALVVDARNEKLFKKGHYKGAINIQNGGKFETWLGSIVGPEEQFYLVAENDTQLDDLISKAAKTGYELLVKGAFVLDSEAAYSSSLIDVDAFRQHQDDYTIVDIRNASEVKTGKFFEKAINIPLPELRERAGEIPTAKPIVVHCAGGYRSAAGSSILEAALPDANVMDLSEAVNDFKNK
ncbi:MBL fold metallo-hydrolase [Pontibacter sp. BT310]|uniref:MBL fold metallo-hydrolase n=1 Tax=Pontibacter populi TaxID=890055 RepID=A0ABS6XEP5_9BACT|nr:MULTISPECIES: rhodanese-like domain-containing protein [Pontibacter]MBJ6119612.1 MBL fold metallo-hydrolase [Pontibacter sp. BT310]MBR0572039.1 MBL fold metallo-hydrolase [Microvirga sp. STS03]MBW3366465.1 MBL fold metallo-hydrolase [Pontibacter populi]